MSATAIVAVLTGVGATSFVGASAWLFKSLVILKETVAAIKAQHVNNGGSTLRDAVDRIEAKVDEQGSKLNDHLVDAAGESAIIKLHIENSSTRTP